MTPPEAVLFDLDGTLTDGGPGLLAAIKEASAPLGAVGESELRRLIGPSLRVGLKELFGIDDFEVEPILAKFHTLYYDSGAVALAQPFEGIVPLLDTLSQSGVTLGVATIRSRQSAETLVEQLGVGRYFRGIFGGRPSDGSDKSRVIEEASRALAPGSRSVVMVGDRKFDVFAAKANSIGFIGALWGFGTREELIEAGASTLAESPSDLAGLLGVERAGL
jgi:phosphoglycolate phosphatase